MVIAIIAILAGLLLPALTRAKMKALRISCLSNEKQFALGSQMFAQDDDNQALSGTVNYADDDMNWLYPQYVPNLKSFVCPGTRNVVRDTTKGLLPGDPGPVVGNSTGIGLYKDRMHGNNNYVQDLVDNAHGGRTNSVGGMSYEVAGFFCGQSPTTTFDNDHNNVRKTEKSIPNHDYFYGPAYPAKVTGSASISDVLLIYDADDASNGPFAI